MDHNIGKIPGTSNNNELQKDHHPRNGAHTERVSFHQIRNLPWYRAAECTKELTALRTFMIIIIINDNNNIIMIIK